MVGQQKIKFSKRYLPIAVLLLSLFLIAIWTGWRNGDECLQQIDLDSANVISNAICNSLPNIDSSLLSVGDEAVCMHGSWTVGELISIRISNNNIIDVFSNSSYVLGGMAQLPRHIDESNYFRKWTSFGSEKASVMRWSRIEADSSAQQVYLGLDNSRTEAIVILYSSNQRIIDDKLRKLFRNTESKEQVGAGVGDDWMEWHRVRVK